MTKRTDGNWRHASLAPPRRLGNLLSGARGDAGVTIEELAERSSDLTVGRLISIEQGSVEIGDRELGQVAELYGVNVTTMVPPRSELVVDLDEGVLRVDGRRSATELGEGADRYEVLSRYLALVCSMRQLEPGTKLTLRTNDLEVLGKALRVGERSLRADLESLMRNPSDLVGWRYRLLSRKVLLPAAGILVSFCGVAALVMVSDDDTAPTPTEVSVVEATPAGTRVTPPEPEVGTAVVQGRNEDGTPGPMTVRGATDESLPTPNGAEIIDAATLER